MPTEAFPFAIQTANEMTWDERDDAYKRLHEWRETTYLHKSGLQMVWKYPDAHEVLDLKTNGISNKNSLDPLIGYSGILRNPRAIGHFIRHLVPPPANATANLTDSELHTKVWNTMAGPYGHFTIAHAEREKRAEGMREHFYKSLRDTGGVDSVTGSVPSLDVTKLSILYAASVTGEAVGLPAKDWPSIARWSGAQSGLLGQSMKGTQLAKAVEALGQLFTVSNAALKSEEPIGFAGRLREEKDIPHRVAKSAMANSLAAGVHTISGSIQQGIERLLGRRDQSWWHSLEGAENAAGIAAKLLQLDPGLVAWKREAIRPITLKSGTRLDKGPILVMFAAANRDETVLRGPEDLSVGGRILTFGSGMHICPGRQLANLAVEVFFSQLYTVMPAASLASGLSKRTPDLLFSGADVKILA